MDDCAPSSRVPPAWLPSWLHSRRAAAAWAAAWLALILAGPAAHAGDLHPAWPAWLALVAISVTFLIAVGNNLQPTGLRASSWLLLGVQAAVTVALVLAVPAASAAFLLLSITAGVTLGRTWGLRVVIATTGLAAVVVGVAEGRAGAITGVAVTTWLAGAGAWSFRELFAVIGELARTREQLARAAVADERERFSRDLHDLLGHTLSVIVVKAQAVRRLAPLDAGAAARHGEDIETIGRRALTEVRQAVGAYRGPGMAAELDRARAALADAGIALHTADDAASGLPPVVDELFGWVVREGVTNVIRHADARQVGIRCGRDDGTARLEIIDDGTSPAGRSTADPGRGLTGLRDRVSAAGGRLEAHPGAGGFQLVVQVPCR